MLLSVIVVNFILITFCSWILSKKKKYNCLVQKMNCNQRRNTQTYKKIILDDGNDNDDEDDDDNGNDG